MPIDSFYDTLNPQHICDGPWGSPGYNGVWTYAWVVGLESKPNCDQPGPYHQGSVIQWSKDGWERIWDSAIKSWRPFNADELAKLPPYPQNDSEWVALKRQHFKS